MPRTPKPYTTVNLTTPAACVYRLRHRGRPVLCNAETRIGVLSPGQTPTSHHARPCCVAHVPAGSIVYVAPQAATADQEARP